METQTNAALEVVGNKPNEVNPTLAKMALSRFETTFRLEGELVGKGKVKMNKRGGITLSLKSLNSKTGDSLAAATGLKGDALEACRQKLAQSLKTEYGVMASRLTSDRNYEAGKAKLEADGTVSLSWKPTKDETILAITDEQAMRALGIDPEKWKAGRELVSIAPVEAKPAEKPENNSQVKPSTLEEFENAQVLEMEALEKSGASAEAVQALEARQIQDWEAFKAATGIA